MSEVTFELDTSMWGPGLPGDMTFDFDSLYFETQGSPQVGFSAGFGGSIYANVSAYLGLSYLLGFGPVGDLVLRAGTVSVDYGISLNEMLSSATETINQKSFIDLSSWSQAASSLSSTGIDIANSGIDLDLVAKLHADLYGGLSYSAGVNIDLGGFWYPSGISWDGVEWSWADLGEINESVSGSTSFNVPLVHFDGEYPLLHLSGGDIDPISVDFDYFTLNAQLPSPILISTSDVVPDGDGLGNLGVSGESSPFLTGTFDVAAAIGGLFGLPPAAFQGSYGGSLGPLSLGVNYTTVQADLVGEVALRQEFSFIPTDVRVSMKSSFGETVTGSLGDRFEFETPQGEGSFTVDASYLLGGQVISEHSLWLTGAFDYSVLKGTIWGGVNLSVAGYGISAGFSEGFGPLLSGSLGIGGGAEIPLFMNVHDYTFDPINLTYTLTYENFYSGAAGADAFTMTTHQVMADGGDGDDVIFGNGLDNDILGGGGDDELSGLGGNDKVDGGAGNDRLIAGSGEGDDEYFGGDGNDTIVFSSTTSGVRVDLMIGTAEGAETGSDFMSGVENVIGGSGNDVLLGDGYANTFSGGGGDDEILAGAGDDNLIGGEGRDQLFGGDGSDTASYVNATAGVAANLTNLSLNAGEASGDTYNSIENLTGSEFADTLRGNLNANVLTGGGGDDTLRGGAGADWLAGGAGKDMLYGDGGADVYTFASADEGGDTIFGLGGGDKICLDLEGFGLQSGILFDEDNFIVGDSAKSALEMLIFDNKSGALYWDADGSGEGAQVLLANIMGVRDINFGDFIFA